MNRHKSIAAATGLLIALSFFVAHADAKNDGAGFDKRRTTTTSSATTSTTVPVGDADFEIVYGQRVGFDRNDLRRGIFRPQIRRALVARTVGITEGRLNSQLRRCRTVAAVATSNGSSGTVVVNTLTSNIAAQINMAVARKWITQTRASGLLAYVPTVAARFVSVILYPSAACNTTTTSAPATTTTIGSTTTVAPTTTTTR